MREFSTHLGIVNRYRRRVLKGQAAGVSIKRDGHNWSARIIEIAECQLGAARREPKRLVRAEYFLCNETRRTLR